MAAYKHTNRRGDVYLLKVGKTRASKPHNYFGRKLTGEPVTEIPARYEVFELRQRGRVFLCRSRSGWSQNIA
jgi:hypothetical protein